MKEIKKIRKEIVRSLKVKLEARLKEIKTEETWDDWQDGVKFGREDMIQEIIKLLDTHE